MTENQGKFIIRILMFIVSLLMFRFGYITGFAMNTGYEKLSSDYLEGQIF